MKLRNWILLFLLVVVPATVSARWIEDKVVYQTESAGNVEFSHYNHLEAVGKNCPSCHNDVFHIVRKKNKSATMAQMEEGKSCGFCHNGERAFSVASDCSMCHPTKDIVFKIPSAGEVTFSHDVHTSMFGCTDCHTGIYNPSDTNPTVSMSKMEGGESCGACHDGETAFSVAEDCSSCHPTKDITFETDAGNATFSHEIHTMMYSCDTCHPDLFEPNSNNTRYSMDEMSDGMSCGGCHDDGTAFTVGDNCDSCHEM